MAQQKWLERPWGNRSYPNPHAQLPPGMTLADIQFAFERFHIEAPAFLRRLVWAALPLREGCILDPFCGAGSTLAAAEALGYESIGVEINPEYVEIARMAVPRLASLRLNPWGNKTFGQPVPHRWPSNFRMIRR